MKTRPEELSVVEFAQRYLKLEILPVQAQVIRALMQGKTVMLARRAGNVTCHKVAAKIRVEMAKPDRERPLVILFDEYPDE